MYPVSSRRRIYYACQYLRVEDVRKPNINKILPKDLSDSDNLEDTYDELYDEEVTYTKDSSMKSKNLQKSKKSFTSHSY